MSRPPLGSIAFLNIPWYSVLIVCAVIIGIFLASREERRLGLPKDAILDFVLWAVPLAVVGARAFYVVFRWDLYENDWLRIFNVREGGLAIYGGILGGLLAAGIVSRQKRISFATLLDACAPALILGQAIGRWGNYANMEAYGPVVTNPALQFFPFAVEIPVNGVWTWHMATFFYESLWCAIGFALIWALRKRARRPGDVMLWYVLWYGVERAVIEGLRTDSLMFLNGTLRISQLLSVLAVVAVLVLFTRRVRPVRALDVLGWGIVLVALVCAAMSVSESSVTWFYVGILMCAVLGLLDAIFMGLYLMQTRRFDWVAGALTLCLAACLAVTLPGSAISIRTSILYVSLRQALCFLHILLHGIWLYWRAYAPSQPRLQKEA